MTRRPPRAPTRRLALALSVMLLAAALAVPAAAENTVVPPDILYPTDGIVVTSDELLVRASATPNTSVNAAVRRTNEGDDTCSVATDRDGIFRDITGGLGTDMDGIWEERIDVSDVENGLYCFAFDPIDGPRISVSFELSDPLVEFDQENETKTCPEDGACTISTTNGDDSVQSFTATSPNPNAKGDGTAQLGLRLPPEDDPIRDAVFAACQDALGDDQRLAGAVAQLVPVGFESGNLTVTNFIPRSVIKEDVNRGTDSFRVCLAPTLAESSAYAEAGYTGLKPLGFETEVGPVPTGLVGPILLDDCGENLEQTACVESRERLPGADLEITLRIPAVDPWMM